MINEQVKELSDFLATQSRYANFHPVDRLFLEPFIDQICALNRNDFLLYNLEYESITYTSYLFLCLPELWENITIKDWEIITSRFTKSFSFFTFIYFVYKYVEVDSVKFILGLHYLTHSLRQDIISYIKNQYHNFIKDETDYFFLDKGAIGVKNEDWLHVKQKLLTDKRLEPALTNEVELGIYVNEMW